MDNEDFEVDPDLPFTALEDPPYRCGWHLDSKKGFRCGAPATWILLGATEESGLMYFPICPSCTAEAVIEGKGNIAHRYGEVPGDLAG